MTTTNANPSPSPDAQVAVKITIGGKDENRKFQLALKDLGATVLPNKLRTLLAIPSTNDVVFERFSDSSGSFIALDSSNPSVYKQLFRAAKAKGKLRLRVTVNEKTITKPEMPKPEMPLPGSFISAPNFAPYIPTIYERSIIGSVRGDSTTPTSIPPISHASPLHFPQYPPIEPEAKPEEKSNFKPSKPPQPSKPYHWPISDNGEFSDAAKSVFEKKENKKPSSVGVSSNAAVKGGDDEAPIPRFFNTQAPSILPSMREQLSAAQAKADNVRSTFAGIPVEESFGLIDKPAIPCNNFTICCNNCEKAIPDAHWHCGICDGGDFDLCTTCVDQGSLCETEDHWLIKRFVKDGKVINSTTETIAPKKAVDIEDKKEIPGAFNCEIKGEAFNENTDLSRTCNSCVGIFDESKFITCLDCEDYDLCMPCHVARKHGHHPSHKFAPASKDANLNDLAATLCAPGRNIRHYATCDGCDETIFGVRYKCLGCPDWDYCSECVQDAGRDHPDHRLIPIYEPIVNPKHSTQKHFGIYCDGPLCKVKDTYIRGDRYKCAVCNDTDFCANCEALPRLPHNRTHPLLKFKTPVRNVSVSTYGEKQGGDQIVVMGDQPPPTSSKSTETTPTAASANASTQVQTVAEVKPTVVQAEPVVVVEASVLAEQDSRVTKEADVHSGMPQIRLASTNFSQAHFSQAQKAIQARKAAEGAHKSAASPELNAHFVRDLVIDGSEARPGEQFEQVWTLRNPGPHAWPAGCSVCYIGGDGMLDVDRNHPSLIADIRKAIRSNIVEHTVEVGGEIDFSVAMRAPERVGKAISYWRLKTSDGLPFGHKMWCDIIVCRPALAKSPPPQKLDETVSKIFEQLEEKAWRQPNVEDEVNVEEQPKSSQMIFPKLDKESPVSSQHDVQAEVVAGTTPSVAESIATPTEKELIEDVESLRLDDASDTDEAFLTDEEYELIASGDEMEEAKNGKK